MKRLMVLILAASAGVLAQVGAKALSVPDGPAGQVTFGSFQRSSNAPVQDEPYSATITNESIQTLGDGNRIVQSNTGMIARDSQGRTRQDAPLPPIGNISAANAPHIVFIQDPVAQTSYTLNLTDKTAMKMPVPPLPPGGPVTAGSNAVFLSAGNGAAMPGPMPAPGIIAERVLIPNDSSQVTTEDLGSQTMEGVIVRGARTTRTIPAGQIGNDNPIVITTEVWTSPDLKTVIYSKRSDPRMGEQTFRLTNIVRSEPDASLFTIPSDFKIADGPQQFIYRTNP